MIEDQPSAAPYNNWNQRIQEECYESNGWSPVLNSQGKIRCILNNYEYISFNFGPTLLSWIKKHSPLTYEKILNGDRKSRIQNNGHGNALAQVYNHIIMPLATEKDRLTQIEWGIRDFQHHFKHDPEGMWLAETAIHPETAEELVRAGIKYTILSPWQAKSLLIDDETEQPVNNSPELWRHPWTLSCPSGDLTVFFYHPGLSSDISFQHLLRDANNFYNRASEELKGEWSQLPIATDGEIYGHHEKLGNMGLTAFLSKVHGDSSLKMGNFGSLMEEASPAGRVILHEGENAKGSSWSCSHGVSRWYKDCGCHTGSQKGWNQKWRSPLRTGFDRLSDEIDRIYRRGMKRLTKKDPWVIRNKYIEVLLEPGKAEEFFDRHGSRRKSETDKNLFFRLLEGQKFKLFMYTSCGWFFADISGLEPVQNMMYAARAVDLYSPFFTSSPENLLLEHLSEAESNITAKGNGAVLYTSRKFELMKERYKMAAWMVLNRYYTLTDPEQNRGFYHTESYNIEKVDDHIYSGTIILKNYYTQAKEIYFFEIEAETKLFNRLTISQGERSQILTPEDLPLRLKKRLLKALSVSRSTDSKVISERFNETVTQLNEMMHLRSPESSSLKDTLNALLYYTLREITYMMEQDIEESWQHYSLIIQTAISRGIDLPVDLTFWLQEILDKKITMWRLKEIHTRQEWKLAYQGLKILLNTTRQMHQKSITYTQTGKICDVLYYTEEGLEILKTSKENIIHGLFQELNLAEDFHSPQRDCD